MSLEQQSVEGGCRCGAIRYRATGAPVLVEYCHCTSCRDAVGAPLVAWAAWGPGAFEITAGDPTPYPSSEGVVRTFCGTCGTSLTITDQRFPDETYVTVASLDEPETLPPEFHIWRAHRLPWLEIADALPRYVQFKSDGIVEA